MTRGVSKTAGWVLAAYLRLEKGGGARRSASADAQERSSRGAIVGRSVVERRQDVAAS